MFRNNVFCTIDELKEFCKNDVYQIIIFGTGIPGQDVFRTLQAYDIEVYAWGDNSLQQQGKVLRGLKVLSREDIIQLKNPLILVACWMSWGAILRSLQQSGFVNIHALSNSIKYDVQKMLMDCKAVRSVQVVGSKILLEVYANIGDIFIHIGIISAFVHRYGSRVYVLAEGIYMASVLRLLTPNVITVTRKRFLEDDNYRRSFLLELNQYGFRMTVVLSDIRIYATQRVLNGMIFPVPQVCYGKILPDGDYLLDLDCSVLRQWFPQFSVEELYPIGKLNKQIQGMTCSLDLPAQYVVINMGASNPIRRYPVKRIVHVVCFLLQQNYSVIFIGAGTYDEIYYQNLKEFFLNEDRVTSYISKLSLCESCYVILKSNFFVGTESGMWNASWVLEKPSIVIYGRGDYGSFKHHEAFVHYVLAPDRGCMGCCWFCMNRAENGMPYCLDDITPDMIIHAIQGLVQRA